MSFHFRVVACSSIKKPRTPDTIIKIDSFSTLAEGWHYGKGGPIVGRVADDAKEVCRYMIMIGFTRTNAFAGADGEILVAAYHGRSYLGIVVEPNNSFGYATDLAGEDRVDLDLDNISQVKSRLLDVAKRICASSGSFIPKTSTGSAINSMTWHSRNRQLGGCPSSA